MCAKKKKYISCLNLFKQQLGAKMTTPFKAAFLTLRFHSFWGYCHVMYFVNLLVACLSFFFYSDFLSDTAFRLLLSLKKKIWLGGVTDGKAVWYYIIWYQSDTLHAWTVSPTLALFTLPLSMLLFVVLADTLQCTDITTHIAAQFERIREPVDDVAGWRWGSLWSMQSHRSSTPSQVRPYWWW